MKLRDREFPDRLGARRKMTPRSSRPARICIAAASYQATIRSGLPITFPLASTQVDLREVRVVLDDVTAEPRAQGHSDRDRLPGGNMDENSAAALLADPFAKEVDFVPIGTHELTQYTLAVDQTNDIVADTHCAAEPAVLRLSATAVDAARGQGIEVSVCNLHPSQPERAKACPHPRRGETGVRGMPWPTCL